jgi:protein phosphatase
VGVAARFDAEDSVPLVQGTIDLASLAGGSAMPCFAVFDGMGGEQQGEVASRIAAEALRDACASGSAEGDPEVFLTSVCQHMNDAVCAYARENGIRRMGTTAVLLAFREQTAFVCNVGDSRAYVLRPSFWFSRHLEQLSCDHSQKGASVGKAPLTQYIGIPADEFIIEPSIVALPLREGTRWLLCSDGLSDMVPEKAIAKALSATGDLGVCANRLLGAALDAGGRDNVTIIICELRKRSGT